MMMLKYVKYDKMQYIVKICAVAIMLMIFALAPDTALAASSSSDSIGFSRIISALQAFATYIMLPLGVLIAAWRIIYLAAFCGIAGIDPLNICDGNVGKWSEELKASISGFVKGLCWIGGIFIIFQFALVCAAGLAGIMEGAFA